MKKLILLLTCSTLLTIAKSQDDKKTMSNAGFHFGAGVNLSLPIGDFNDTHSFGIGIEAQPEYNLTDMFSVYGSAGYTNFFGKSIDYGGGSFDVDDVGLIPILVGAKVYPAPQFFIGAKIGVGILTGGGDSESAFDYQPQIGYNGNKIQVNLGYNGLTKEGETLSNLSLTFLYKFK